MAFKLASKVVICCIIDVLIVALAASGATRSEQSPGQRPVVSGEALVMLHWAMRSISHRRTAMAIKMACDGGAFVHRRHHFRLL